MNFKGAIESLSIFFVGLGLVASALFLFTRDHVLLSNGAGFMGSNGLSHYVAASPIPVVPHKAAPANPRTPWVRIGETEIPVEIATTSAAVQKGLSGRPSLDADTGMLFVFSRADRYRFWMPDMHFAIDIIWINDGRVIDTDENVSPKFDPLHPLFSIPAKPARYVLEVNAGFVKHHHIRVGDRVSFYHIW